MRVGLVLGAGGYAGQGFHAGVLSAVAEATGWDPRTAAIIVGTSAGSGVASWLREGMSAADLAARAVGAPLSPHGAALVARAGGGAQHGRRSAQRSLRPASPRLLATLARRPWTLTAPRLATALLPAGSRSTDFVSDEVTRVSGERWPQEPMWLVAVDLEAGERVVFGRPGAPPATRGEAIAASCAIPSFFAPVEIDGRRYVDGGIHSPTNADLLAGQDLDLVIVSSPMSGARGAGRHAVDRAARAISGRRLRGEVGCLRADGTPVLCFQPSGEVVQAMGTHGMDPACRKEVAQTTREQALELLTRPRGVAAADLLRSGPAR